ncbi:MAG: hypothetical protein ATN34_02105 [Epulopiscium sp. Nele67-Bin002]|nr:MAG: hypothetical protein BEN18_08215 [Epulopiscium sp. Nuni2H_MBin001]OON91056.1 MAG: hypothetical protein ATN34_02105 [Epulopiscium sp. Nele67-Bin002]OON93289.1 MAG: hypothetical protein ATN33_05995 [Epulopiscium sp. Nele67-Bin001]
MQQFNNFCNQNNLTYLLNNPGAISVFTFLLNRLTPSSNRPPLEPLALGVESIMLSNSSFSIHSRENRKIVGHMCRYIMKTKYNKSPYDVVTFKAPSPMYFKSGLTYK